MTEKKVKEYLQVIYVLQRDGTVKGVSIAKEMGLKKNGLPHIHPHAFRHTVASNMIADGIDLVTAANELGHADPTTTAKIYAHQIAAAKAKASKVRSNVFSRAI